MVINGNSISVTEQKHHNHMHQYPQVTFDMPAIEAIPYLMVVTIREDLQPSKMGGKQEVKEVENSQRTFWQHL